MSTNRTRMRVAAVVAGIGVVALLAAGCSRGGGSPDSTDDGARSRLEALGYEWWGEYGLVGRRYLTLVDEATGRRLVQLHSYADGNAEIVFAANADVNRCSAIPDYTGLQAGIRVFRDAADNWVGTRPVWNEHTYHVTNVRQDLSIPAPEQPNWRRFNTFRQNSQSFDAPNLVPGATAATYSAVPLTFRVRIPSMVECAPGPNPSHSPSVQYFKLCRDRRPGFATFEISYCS